VPGAPGAGRDVQASRLQPHRVRLHRAPCHRPLRRVHRPYLPPHRFPVACNSALHPRRTTPLRPRRALLLRVLLQHLDSPADRPLCPARLRSRAVRRLPSPRQFHRRRHQLRH
jgi:hypothetical protein